MNVELARQHARITVVRARIATRPKLAKPARVVRLIDPAPTPESYVLRHVVRYTSPHYDHVRVWRRVERARRPKGPRVEDVLDAACEAWGTTRDMLLRADRRQEPVARKHVVMFLCRELARGISLPDIGARLGCDHTTVMHACRAVRRRRRMNEAGVETKIADVLRYLGLGT